MKVLEKCAVCSSGKWEGEECQYCNGWIDDQLLMDRLRRTGRIEEGAIKKMIKVLRSKLMGSSE